MESLINLPKCGLICIAFVVALAANFVVAPLWAASYSADSNITTEDTTAGLRSIAGRVLDAQTRAAISGATVTYSGTTRTTDSAGKFLFSGGSWLAGQMLSTAKSGYGTANQTLNVAAGVRDAVVEDILLSLAGKFSVVSIKPRYDGLFLSSVSFINEYTAIIDWGGRTPGSAENTYWDTTATNSKAFFYRIKAE